MVTAEISGSQAFKNNDLIFGALMDDIRSLGDKLGEDAGDGFLAYVYDIKQRTGASRIEQDVLVSAAKTYILMLQRMLR